jgi:SAM-dependent methyltransferase
MAVANTYYDNINRELYARIPPGCGRVLEVGCGVGSLGAKYKAENPGCFYCGVEIHRPSAEIAAGRLDQVMACAIDDADLGAYLGSFDCIVYGDLLEHLTDPWATLARHRALLAETGRVAACIPNVQFWKVLQDLLHGRWAYGDEGILDRTHLRFFTLETIQQMFQSAGFAVDQVTGRYWQQAEAAAFAEAMRPALAALGADFDRFKSMVSVFQYVVGASKA